MSNFLISATLVGASLLCAADEPAATPPVTKEAAPAESATTPPSKESDQGKSTKPEPVKPKAESGTAVDPAAEGDTDPLPDFKTPTEATPNASESTSEATPPEASSNSDALVRPTEQTDRSGKRVAAFWFISTGK